MVIYLQEHVANFLPSPIQQTTFLAMFEIISNQLFQSIIDSSSPEDEIIIYLGNKEWRRLDLDLSLLTGKHVIVGLTADCTITLKGPKWQVVHFQQTNLQMMTAIQKVN